MYSGHVVWLCGFLFVIFSSCLRLFQCAEGRTMTILQGWWVSYMLVCSSVYDMIWCVCKMEELML